MIVLDFSKANIFKPFVLIFFLLILVLAICAYPPFLSRTLAVGINSVTKPIFSETVSIDEAWFDSNLNIHIKNFQAVLQTESGPVPIAVRNIESTMPVYKIFQPDGINFDFQGARFQHSNRVGVDGKIRITGIRKWLIVTQLNVIDIGLDELVWLNSDNLKGSTGKIFGLVKAGANYSGRLDMDMALYVKDPGGTIQGKFFGLLTPYLPSQATKEIVKQLASLGGLVRYKNAELHLNLIRSNQLKVILKMLVPDYNLNLNINMLIRLDEGNSFTDLAQLTGIIKTK